MAELLACPFCRELFHETSLEKCPVCGVALLPMHKLPPSYEQKEEERQRLQAIPPEYRVLPWTYLGRGRGSMIAVSLLGLLCFFSPWVELFQPDEVVLSGFDMARTRAGWLWGGAVGWFVCIPLVLSRRSVVDLRGVRVICATFAAMTVAETGMMLLIPPGQSVLVRSQFAYSWGLYASLVVALAGVAAAVKLGGRIDDLRDLSPSVTNETSEGQQIH